MLKTLLTLIAASLLVACGGAKSDFLSACEGSTGMTDENCECLADLASKELPDDGLLWLTAMIEEDDKALRKLRSESESSEWVKIAGFMMAAPMQCAIDMNTWNSDQ